MTRMTIITRRGGGRGWYILSSFYRQIRSSYSLHPIFPPPPSFSWCSKSKQHLKQHCHRQFYAPKNILSLLCIVYVMFYLFSLSSSSFSPLLIWFLLPPPLQLFWSWPSSVWLPAECITLLYSLHCFIRPYVEVHQNSYDLEDDENKISAAGSKVEKSGRSSLGIMMILSSTSSSYEGNKWTREQEEKRKIRRRPEMTFHDRKGSLFLYSRSSCIQGSQAEGVLSSRV